MATGSSASSSVSLALAIAKELPPGKKLGSFQNAEDGKTNKTNLMSATTPGDNKVVPKKARNRTNFTEHQLKEMARVFDQTPYLSGQVEEDLVRRLGLNRKNVRIWFQNRRRRSRKNQSVQNRDQFQYPEWHLGIHPCSAAGSCFTHCYACLPYGYPDVSAHLMIWSRVGANESSAPKDYRSVQLEYDMMSTHYQI